MTILKGDPPYPILYLAFDAFMYSLVLSPGWDGRRNGSEFSLPIPCCNCSDMNGWLFVSVSCRTVPRNSLGTQDSLWFYKALQSKTCPVANVQQEVHVVLRSVFVLLLVSKNTSGFKQVCVMF